MKNLFLILVFFNFIAFCFGQSDSTERNYFYNKGVEELKLKNYQESILSFTKAIKKNPFDIDAYYNRGVANLKIGIKDSACGDWSYAFVLGDTGSKKLLNKYCDSLVILHGDTCREQKPSLILPRFKGGKGGERAMFEFLQNNMHYPEAAKDNMIQGRVYVNFIVRANGEGDNFNVIRDIGGGCGEESLRVVKLMQWEPGTMCGKPVDIMYTLPIVFNLE